MSGEEQTANQGAKEQAGGEAAAAGKQTPNDKVGKTTAPRAGSEETLKLGASEMIQRRSMWQSSLAALRYVSSVSHDDEVKVRDSDKATSLFLLIVCIFALLTLILPQLASSNQPSTLLLFLRWMDSQRVPIALTADVLVGIAILRYVANRFGIMTTLTPRQALLCWHLMLGASLLGIFMSINLALVCCIAVSNTHIVIPEAHPGVLAPAPAKAGQQVQKVSAQKQVEQQ